MDVHELGQVSKTAAEIYEDFFLPAAFQFWTRPVTAAAQVQSGDQVLDVACGTGVLARAALNLVGSSGSVTGLDINEGMLEVAKAKAPSINWQRGDAEALPFPDNHFDKVLSQFSLMFFNQKATALKEMARVAKPGGRLTIAVWASLEQTPGYVKVRELLNRLFGETAAKSIDAPYALGDANKLKKLGAEAGLDGMILETQIGNIQFDSIEAWMHTEIRGWTLADSISDQDFERLLVEARKDLAPFKLSSGKVTFDAAAHIIVWQKPV
ncbi:MAG: methyltransferase domain-containing protein [Trueperaceae bacterium]|nr:methyltransferase domain-containing protein [Trueperaceae bacterium]